MLQKRKSPVQLDDYLYEAKNQADLRRQNNLKLAIPVVTVGCLFAYPYIGTLGIGAIALSLIGYCQKMGKDIRRDWERIDKLDRTTLYRYCPAEYRKGMKDALLGANPSSTNQSPVLPPARDDNTGDSEIASLPVGMLLNKGISIGLFGDSGSGKTTLAKTILSYCCCRKNMAIAIIDPDFDPEDNPWGNATVISDYDTIFSLIPVLVDWLKQRKKEPLTIFVDELTDIRLEAESRGKEVLKMLDDFVLRYAVRGRKYNKVLIIGTQSSNVESIGLKGKGDFLQSFSILRLGDIAKKYAKNLPDRSINAAIQSIAYPVLVGDSELFLHPNLGHHSSVKNNNKPQNMVAISSAPLFPELNAIVTGATPTQTTPHPPVITSATPVPPSPSPENQTQGGILTPRQQITEFVDAGRSERWILEDHFSLTKNSAKWREYRDIIRDIKDQNNDNFTPYQWMP